MPNDERISNDECRMTKESRMTKSQTLMENRGLGHLNFVILSSLVIGNSSIGWNSSGARGATLDLSKAVIVSPENLSKPETKALELLIEEVQKRTGIRWEIFDALPKDSTSVIAFRLPNKKHVKLRVPGPAEGYSIRVTRMGERPTVLVIGNDSRGMLFGVGRLLRELQMSRGKVALAEDFNVTTAPRFPLRGHQLGYRPKTNSYDGWNLAQWEQYIRDLAVFGTNAVELIPPRSDDAADSPHFPLPPMEMMVGMSKLLDDYGLDVWIWYPAMDVDYAKSETVAFALKEWGEVFKKLPRIDAVFVPGGDPG